MQTYSYGEVIQTVRGAKPHAHVILTVLTSTLIFQ